MRHIITLLACLWCVSALAQEKDYTTRVKNTTTAWGGTGTYKAGDINCIEYYSTGHFYHGTFLQTITALPIGVYEAEVYFNASCAAWECAEICGNGTTGRCHLFANDVEVDVPIYNVKQIEAPTLHVMKNIHVTDGTLRLGARNDREGANWHLIRLKSLRLVGTDARCLYDAQFPLIRQARIAMAASTCPNNQQMLQTALSESMNASAYDTPERLQTLYDNITLAIRESEAFEKKKATALKNAHTRLASFQRVWNNGTKPVNEEQWRVLLPAVRQLCVAKDSECDLDAIDDARNALSRAMTEATGIAPLLAPQGRASAFYDLQGRQLPAHQPQKGVYLQYGRKLIR